MRQNADILKCVDILQNQGVILHATDTIWGLGASIFEENAVEKIYEIKNRERNKPLIILVSDYNMLSAYIPDIHPRIDALHTYYDRPLTVIYPSHQNIPPYLLTPEKTIAVRIVMDSHCSTIIKELGHPIVSTSANIAGKTPPSSYLEIAPTVLEKVDYTSNHRRTETDMRNPSVIISYDTEGNITFHRS